MSIFWRVTVIEKSSGDIICNRDALAEQQADDWHDYYELLYGESKGHILIKQSYDTKRKAIEMGVH